jgi:hypothetical protein
MDFSWNRFCENELLYIDNNSYVNSIIVINVNNITVKTSNSPMIEDSRIASE